MIKSDFVIYCNNRNLDISESRAQKVLAFHHNDYLSAFIELDNERINDFIALCRKDIQFYKPIQVDIARRILEKNLFSFESALEEVRLERFISFCYELNLQVSYENARESLKYNNNDFVNAFIDLEITYGVIH